MIYRSCYTGVYKIPYNKGIKYEKIITLDQGKKIALGSPKEIQNNNNNLIK